ncbi:glycosyltransferase [Rhodococcus cerastii]|uniref:Glycosyltransferase n=1 Tax=Rhodococcus cerastii TaxID=908616 RepID=A0ABU4D3Z4_9NOCA|nr:glycosyltransferase [Rhodococcus cerastii]MDV6304445.1 glycosyltransferase [Rhodococcus cerastii]
MITISYKDPEGLLKTIDSTRSQVGSFDIEHLVVDGGSGTTVENLLSLHEGGPSNMQWSSEPDEGRYDAMNKGISRARGDLLWFMHSTDRFGSTDAIQQVLDACQDPRKSWGYGFARLVNNDGQLQGLFGEAPFNLHKFALGYKSVPHQACFFGRDVIAALGPYDTDFGLAADQLYILRAVLVQPPIVVPELVCDFDTSGAGTGRSSWSHFGDMARARRMVGLTFFGNLALDRAATFALSLNATLRSKLTKYLSNIN